MLRRMHRAKFVGHKGSITCFEFDPFQIVYSGSEDRTVRLWDISKSNKSQRCIGGCFDSAITSVKLGIGCTNTIHIASESSLYVFDTRFDGIINKVPLHQSSADFDGINNIDTCRDNCFIAIADDAGIHLLQLPQSTDSTSTFKTHSFLGIHSNLVSSVHWNPINAEELLSGGYDCLCCIWDTKTGELKSSINFCEALEQHVSSHHKSQMLNPPFVSNCLYIRNGEGILCGLGDGTVMHLILTFLVRTYEVFNCVDGS